ncbi:hypothetical protein ACQPZG_05105 (plasmid) [Streptomyces sp. CA-294286]|uniref:hypothetical protein n=1 Tax=Streptomyces sp. CA-294286 TaxID=3240070 RepID=UPI003D8A170E
MAQAAFHVVTGETGQGPASAQFVSSLKGEARVGYEVRDQEVRIAVNARSTYAAGSTPVTSKGTFRISHAQDGQLYWGEFEVDCLTTGGPNATVTGRLVRTSPDHPWLTELPPHVRMGASFSVPKHGRSRVGIAVSSDKGAPELTRCMAPAADMPVIESGYTLRDRQPTEQL